MSRKWHQKLWCPDCFWDNMKNGQGGYAHHREMRHPNQAYKPPLTQKPQDSRPLVLGPIQ